MKRICVLLFLTMGFAGTSLDNKAEEIAEYKPEESIQLDTITVKIQTLDSLLNELNKHQKYEKHRK